MSKHTRPLSVLKKHSNETQKSVLHTRNLHRGRYDFSQLVQSCPELAQYVAINKFGDESIDFSNPVAVKTLNRALLQQVYNINEWDIPPLYLCPPIPGRADYLHHLADLLAAENNAVIPHGEQIRVLDIGTGANCIYPLLGHRIYGWKFIGADIDAAAIANAKRIVEANHLNNVINLRLQPSPEHIFVGIIQPEDVFDLTLCNPPFHASLADATAGTQRKWKNLGVTARNNKASLLNFGGHNAELFCKGGEADFMSRMVSESVKFADRCLWFSSLISKAENLPGVYRMLKQAGVKQYKTIEMAQGQKKSRFVAWSFLDERARHTWCKTRWK